MNKQKLIKINWAEQILFIWTHKLTEFQLSFLELGIHKNEKPKWEGGALFDIKIYVKTLIYKSQYQNRNHAVCPFSILSLLNWPLLLVDVILSSILEKAAALCFGLLFLLMILSESPRSDVRACPLCPQDTKQVGEKWPSWNGLMFSFPGGLSLDR